MIIIEPWDWTISNGEASAEETQIAYQALIDKDEFSKFSYKVWNDIVNKINEVNIYLEREWWSKYASYVETLVEQSGDILTDDRFNSARANIRYPYWDWQFNRDSEGYLGRLDVRGVNHYGWGRADKVFGVYLLELLSNLNVVIRIINGTEPIVDIEAKSNLELEIARALLEYEDCTLQISAYLNSILELKAIGISLPGEHIESILHMIINDTAELIARESRRLEAIDVENLNIADSSLVSKLGEHISASNNSNLIFIENFLQKGKSRHLSNISNLKLTTVAEITLEANFKLLAILNNILDIDNILLSTAEAFHLAINNNSELISASSLDVKESVKSEADNLSVLSITSNLIQRESYKLRVLNDFNLSINSDLDKGLAYHNTIQNISELDFTAELNSYMLQHIAANLDSNLLISAKLQGPDNWIYPYIEGTNAFIQQVYNAQTSGTGHLFIDFETLP